MAAAMCFRKATAQGPNTVCNDHESPPQPQAQSHFDFSNGEKASNPLSRLPLRAVQPNMICQQLVMSLVSTGVAPWTIDAHR